MYRLGNEPLGLTEVLISVVTGCVSPFYGEPGRKAHTSYDRA